eukprot:6328745-Alexandrium_andersonii.AAC.1
MMGGGRQRRWMAPEEPGRSAAGDGAGPALGGARLLGGCLAGAQPEAAGAGSPSGGGGGPR